MRGSQDIYLSYLQEEEGRDEESGRVKLSVILDRDPMNAAPKHDFQRGAFNQNATHMDFMAIKTSLGVCVSGYKPPGKISIQGF
jgi:hypothetical protein